jgi:hypothetical protein
LEIQKMSLFLAYLLITVIPGVKLIAGVGCIAWATVGGALLSALLDKLNRVHVVWLVAPVFVLGLLYALTPSKTDMAMIVALKVGTGPEAMEVYGEAGQYLKTWLEVNTEQLQNSVDPTAE